MNNKNYISKVDKLEKATAVLAAGSAVGLGVTLVSVFGLLTKCALPNMSVNHEEIRLLLGELGTTIALGGASFGTSLASVKVTEKERLIYRKRKHHRK